MILGWHVNLNFCAFQTVVVFKFLWIHFNVNGTVLVLQCARLEDQRSILPGGSDEVDLEDVTVAVDGAAASVSAPNKAPTVPDEDFFSLILRLQSGRMEDQRAAVPANSSRYQHPPLSEKTLNAKTNNSGAPKEKK